MRRVTIHRPGGYDRLRLETVADPVPGANEVVVQVTAAGVNYADCAVRMGLYRSAKEYVGWPITPGFEFAGTVIHRGHEVTTPSLGDRVMGVSRFNAYASHVVARHDQVFAIPTGWTDAQAGGFLAVYLTAWYALCELAHPRPNSTLLVHSAAGGVGGALVNLGKILGCRVVGVVGATHKVGLTQRLGADAVVDKSREDLWAAARHHAPGGYDVVFDANGVSTLWQSYRHLRAPGKLVSYGFHSMLPRNVNRRGTGRPNYFRLLFDYLRTPRFNPILMTNANKSVLCFNLSYLFDEITALRLAMSDLQGWIVAGKIPPPTVQTFKLDDVADAHREIESGQTIGKLVLLP